MQFTSTNSMQRSPEMLHILRDGRWAFLGTVELTSIL